MSVDTSIWYENLPDKWISKKLKYIVDLRNEKIVGGEIQNYIGLENIESKTGKFLPSINSEINIEGISNQFYKGDILFGKLRPYLAKCIEAEFDGVGTTELLALKGNTKLILSKYLKFMMLSPKFIDYINSSTYGTKMPRASWDFIGNIEVPLPSINHQQRIIDFITSKVSSVDKLLLQKKHLINLLEQQRQSIITEAVTKGLNSNVKTKDSGVEWIGEIPEHWFLKKLKFLLKPGSEGIKIGPFGSSLKLEQMVDKGYKVYGQENLIKDDFSAGEKYIDNKTYDLLKNYAITENDVLVSMMGTIGKCKVVSKDIEEGIMDSHLIRMRFHPTYIVSEYVALVISNSNYISHQFKLSSKGTIMSGLNSGIIKSLVIAVPPLKEQEEILEFLNLKLKEIKNMTSEVKLQIEKLKEYRQSLIYEAVTGKIDVRDMELD